MFFAGKRIFWIFSVLVLFVFFEVSEIREKMRIMNQCKIVIYNTANPMVHLVNGRKNYLITNNYGKLTRYEKSIAERLRINLRLDQPTIISGDTVNLKYGDLVINKGSVQFCNSLIVMKNQQRIELEIYRGPNRIEQQTIVFNAGKTEKQDTSGVYYVRQNGAYLKDLIQN
jgi:hypothetical protein